jgi:hypothetical protein
MVLPTILLIELHVSSIIGTMPESSIRFLACSTPQVCIAPL